MFTIRASRMGLRSETRATFSVYNRQEGHRLWQAPGALLIRCSRLAFRTAGCDQDLLPGAPGILSRRGTIQTPPVFQELLAQVPYQLRETAACVSSQRCRPGFDAQRQSSQFGGALGAAGGFQDNSACLVGVV